MKLLEIYDLVKEINFDNRLDEANLKKLYTKNINDAALPEEEGGKLIKNINARADSMGESAVRYYGLSEDGTLNFKVKSQTRPGKYHYVFIESADLLKFGYLTEEGMHFEESDLAKLLTMDGFRIQCNCESFLYWAFQYMATVGGYEINPETRAPQRNNTGQKGALCFTGETEVLTSEGFKYIKDIKVGDLVFSHTGKLNKVIDIGSREAEIWKVNVANNTINTTEEHPFLINGKRWVKTKDLKVNDKVTSPKLVLSNSEERVPKGFAFMLGYYLADGSARLKYYDTPVYESKYPIIDEDKVFKSVEFVLDDRFSEEYTRLFDSLGFKYSIKSKNDGTHCSILKIAGVDELENKLIHFLYSYGNLTYKDIYAKKLSSEVLNWSDEDKLDLLAGFFFGDGSFNSSGTGALRLNLSNSNTQILDILFIILSGFTKNVRYYKTHKVDQDVLLNDRATKRKKDLYCLSVTNDFVKVFVDRYPELLKVKWFTIKHTYNFNYKKRVDADKDYYLRTIKGVEATNIIDTVYNISVENDSSYLVTRDLIAVHNCKHLMVVIKCLYENKQIRQAACKDIDNYLRMLAGMDYEDYQQLNHAKQIKQQNRAVKWKGKPSDYCTDYFARQAKHHPFLDDHDIVKSLRAEVRKYVKANNQASVDDFLKDYFSMTKKGFADEMGLSEGLIDDYFNEELDFQNQKDKAQSKVSEPDSEEIEEVNSDEERVGNKSNII